MDELRVYFSSLQTATPEHDRRLVSRLCNRLATLRPKLTRDLVGEALASYSTNPTLLSLYNKQPAGNQTTPVQNAFAGLLAINHLVDSGKSTVEAALSLVQQILKMNLRELDAVLARSYHLLLKAAQASKQTSDIHNGLMAGLRTCQLRHDGESFQTVHNAMARVYMTAGQWDMLGNLFKNSPFPKDTASHNQLARHLYYEARLLAVKLDYRQSFDCLEQALRKAPPMNAPFRTACLKLLVIVQLLMGEIPELSLFTATPALHPHYQLARAVRRGDLKAFQAAIAIPAFSQDDTESLVLRLHQNVLKAGLKRINLCYSRISIADVSAQLGLSSVDDCLMIVMKAIRDGVIVGSIEGDVLVAGKRNEEPCVGALEHRITLCQSFIQETVKAMRFPKPEVKKVPIVASVEAEPSIDDFDEEDLMMDEEFY